MISVQARHQLEGISRHRFMPHQSPKVEYMPPALDTHQHHPSTPERYGCAYHEGSLTSREAQTRCLVLTDPGQQHQQRVTVGFILTVLTVSVPAWVHDSWDIVISRGLITQYHWQCWATHASSSAYCCYRKWRILYVCKWFQPEKVHNAMLLTATPTISSTILLSLKFKIYYLPTDN